MGKRSYDEKGYTEELDAKSFSGACRNQGGQ